MDTEVIILAIAIAVLAFVLLSVIGSSGSRNTRESGGGLRAMKEGSDEEEEAQKAKADALAAHDATFRNGPSGG